ncbi:MAG: DEAD/DEAH box helicase, partial [Melioribacteraceae bacterium]|nr:DEAD/DEAH box helicase [Melioribacteraceae bacterium]
MIQLNAFKSTVEKTAKAIQAKGTAVDIEIDLTSNIEIHSMKKNQKKVYDDFRFERYFIMIEPPGAGKSTTVKFVLGDRLVKDDNHKVIIAVPQTLIAKSFGQVIIKYPNGKKIEWDMGNNLCSVSKTKKIDELIKFLNKREFTKGIHNRILITTHYTLARAYDRINNIDQMSHNTTFVIDEAHHILYPDSNNGYSETSNKIGRIIYDLIEIGNPSTSIWLATATFFRGDKGLILSDDVIDQFVVYELKFDKHWRENIIHIETFEYNFVIYNYLIPDAIKLLKDNKKKTIIFCPYRGIKLEGLEKLEFKDKLTKEILKVWPECNIVDLVDMDNRRSRKDLLLDDNLAKDVDVILSVRMFDEGADWVYAEQILDLNPSQSLRTQVQRIGREWRDLIDKNHISYYAFLRHSKHIQDNKSTRELLVNAHNSFMASVLFQEIVEPVKFPRVRGKRVIPPLERAIPDTSKRKRILSKIMNELLVFRSKRSNPKPSETKQKIKEILEKKKIDSSDDVIKHIGVLLRRGASHIKTVLVPNKGEQIDWMSKHYNEIFRKDIYDDLLIFGTVANDVSSFEEFRKLYRRNRIKDDRIALAEKLTAENGGLLPSAHQMSKM